MPKNSTDRLVALIAASAVGGAVGGGLGGAQGAILLSSFALVLAYISTERL